MQWILVPGHNPGPWTGAGTNTYLLPHDEPALIDAGVGAPQHLDHLRSRLAEHGPSAPALRRVLVTHGHIDHVSGAGALREAWPTVELVKYPWPGEDEKHAATWTAIRDDELVEAAGRRLWALHTPGHSPDHVAFFEPRSGTLFGGDLVQNGSTVVIPVSHGGNLQQYLDSLRRILELRPRRILPGHGPPIEQPAALLRAYLAHRQQRDEQIVDALKGGPISVDEIVTRLYQGLDAALAGAARENVLAHVFRLQSAGHVAQDGGRWYLL